MFHDTFRPVIVRLALGWLAASLCLTTGATERTWTQADPLPSTPMPWAAALQAPQADPAWGVLNSVTVEATLQVDWQLRGTTTAEGYYGAYATWSTRIFAASGACCGGRIDGSQDLMAQYDAGANAAFVMNGSERDTFNMNAMTDPAVLALWRGTGWVDLVMEAFEPRLAFVWEPATDVFVPPAGNDLPGQWTVCEICWGSGPPPSQFFLHPSLAMSAAITELKVTYDINEVTQVPEPTSAALMMAGLALGIGLRASRPPRRRRPEPRDVSCARPRP